MFVNIADGRKIKRIIYSIFFLLLLPIISGHEIERSFATELSFFKYPIAAVYVTAILLAILVLISILVKEKLQNEKIKLLLFILIVIPIILTSLYLITGTIYKNVISETKEPVHWHADFEIWTCDNQLDIIDPKGLINRIGTPLFHEHGENRIHIEGAVLEKKNIALHHFFEVIGGSLEKNKIIIPTNEKIVEYQNGDLCDGEESIVQVFLYKIKNPDPRKKSGFIYEQIKVDNFEEYILSPYSNIPPGDCIIIEFGPEKQSTDKICTSYRLAEERGHIKKA